MLSPEPAGVLYSIHWYIVWPYPNHYLLP